MQGPGQGAEAVAMIVGFICGFVVVFALALLIGAAIFRAACSLFNKFCQPESRVPDPTFGKAVLIVFVSGLIQNIVGFVIGLAIGVVCGIAGLDPDVAQVLAGLASIPFSLVIASAINMWLLPTTFLRGLVVALLQLAIAIVIGLGIAAIIVVVLLMVGGLRGFG